MSRCDTETSPRLHHRCHLDAQQEAGRRHSRLGRGRRPSTFYTLAPVALVSAPPRGRRRTRRGRASRRRERERAQRDRQRGARQPLGVGRRLRTRTRAAGAGRREPARGQAARLRRRSLARRHNTNSDHQAIRLAVQEGVTGTDDVGRGMGLHDLVQHVTDLRGSVRIRSGSTAVTFRSENRLKTDSVRLPQRGTVLGAMIPCGGDAR